MASANISFDQIPASIRKPGKYFEFNTTNAVRTLAANSQKMLIIAQKAEDSDAPLVPVQIYDDATAGALFGYGSQAQLMVQAAIRAYQYLDLSVLPVPPDEAGVAASGKLELTGTATGAGVVSLTIADTSVAVAAASQDTAQNVLDELAAALNAEQSLPVSATVVTPEDPDGEGEQVAPPPYLTLTAKNKGTIGNKITLSASCTAPGLTATVTKMSGGQKDPDITEALAAVFGADYTLYCLPWAVQEQLTALREHLDKISGPLEQRRATAWLGSTDTLSLCTTLAGQLNSGRISLACLPGSPSLPETLSAAYCAVAASEEDPARPLNTLVLTGVAVPPESSRLSRTEQEVALKNGVTPLEVGPGEVVQIVRAISTYTRNAAGATDISLLDMTTIRTLDYVARTVKERIDLRFPREKLSTRTPPKVRSEVLDVLRQLEQLEIVEEVGQENAFIFGLSSDEVINYENNGGYNPMEIFNTDQDIRRVLMQLINGYYSPQDPELFRDIYNSLLNTQSSDRADTYFILKDFRSYAEAQKRVEAAYRDENWWARAAMLNTASAGKFSSDRTIEEYVRDIWHLEKIHVDDDDVKAL